MYTDLLGLDASPDDILSKDNDNGMWWSDAWNDLSTNAGSIWDSTVKTATEYGNALIQDNVKKELSEGSNTVNNGKTDNSNSTLQSNANNTVGNSSVGGLAIDSQTMMIGGGLLLGAVVLIAILK